MHSFFEPLRQTWYNRSELHPPWKNTFLKSSGVENKTEQEPKDGTGDMASI